MKLQTFLSRLPAGSTRLIADVSTPFDISATFEKKVAAIKSDPTLSPQGQRNAIAALSEGGLSAHLQQLREGVERDLAGVRGERSRLVPASPDKSDIIGEMQRAEIRAMLLGMPHAERMKVAFESADQRIKDAILHAPPMLSGLPEDVHGHVVAAESERLFGPRLAELAEHESALETVQAAIQVASDDLGRASRIDGVAA